MASGAPQGVADAVGAGPIAKTIAIVAIEATDSEGAADPAALAAAFKASGAQLVCLCSSDKVYGEHAAAAAKALHAAGARHIYLAGRPGEHEAALRAAGVQDFIFAGGDALAMLTGAWQRLEQP